MTGRDWRRLPCTWPNCHAGPYEPCVNPATGKPLRKSQAHASRVEAAAALAPPPPPAPDDRAVTPPDHQFVTPDVARLLREDLDRERHLQ